MGRAGMGIGDRISEIRYEQSDIRYQLSEIRWLGEEVEEFKVES